MKKTKKTRKRKLIRFDKVAPKFRLKRLQKEAEEEGYQEHCPDFQVQLEEVLAGIEKFWKQDQKEVKVWVNQFHYVLDMWMLGYEHRCEKIAKEKAEHEAEVYCINPFFIKYPEGREEVIERLIKKHNMGDFLRSISMDSV